MAITLGSEALGDAEVTDGIGRGDVEAAASLWVRYWPTALASARQFVNPDEVPGLAAEALVGTIAAISVGRGPREDLSSFVTAAVAELGESDVPPEAGGAPVPDVFVSPLMTRAFAGLSEEDQEILWSTGTGTPDGYVPTEARLRALTALQRDYLAEHTEHAEDPDCQQAHAALAAGVARGVPLAGTTWVHLSECAWCTEAFHELAFSNVALSALVDRGSVAPTPVAAAPAVAATLAPTTAAASAETPGHPMEVEAQPEPDDEPVGAHATEVAPVGLLRRRRTRIFGGAVLAAAAVTAALLVLTGPDDSASRLTAAGSEQTQEQDAPEPVVSDFVAPPVAAESPTPTPTPSAVAPSSSTRVTAPVAQPTPTDQPTPTPTPTPKAPAPAAPTPRPSAQPTASAEPTPTPTPAPTPTPTSPPCSNLAHFFGFC